MTLRCLALTAVLVLLAAPVLAQPGDLPFPQTEAGIVATLAPWTVDQGEYEPLFDTGEDAESNEPSEEGEEHQETMAGALIAFAPDTADILEQSSSLLDEFGKAFSGELDQGLFSIVGHVDKGLPPQMALDLSLARAEAVKLYLVTNYGLDPNRFLVQGYGDMSPFPEPENGEPEAVGTETGTTEAEAAEAVVVHPNDRIEFISLF
ncbi:MAG: hypothetical protein D6E12_14190 [Desulfovibrio sp.]|nr:MAG: hypothetical protein D6E12_14190 [Desulfovibrio sp.]